MTFRNAEKLPRVNALGAETEQDAIRSVRTKPLFTCTSTCLERRPGTLLRPLDRVVNAALQLHGFQHTISGNVEVEVMRAELLQRRNGEAEPYETGQFWAVLQYSATILNSENFTLFTTIARESLKRTKTFETHSEVKPKHSEVNLTHAKFLANLLLHLRKYKGSRRKPSAPNRSFCGTLGAVPPIARHLSVCPPWACAKTQQNT